ncbi:hypothetical protein [Holospora curviuscula]|uniref:Uncharacterized protein n=1 Tax=Holospora curviuscula TaxID=1082868 RepID=A0A2S5R8T7_9PROT|nr:hypothetical protein [Holospora curviuscula]PPE03738.1 hypothetical protein HCUR_00753 [Holospora curviuscula]
MAKSFPSNQTVPGKRYSSKKHFLWKNLYLIYFNYLVIQKGRPIKTLQRQHIERTISFDEVATQEKHMVEELPHMNRLAQLESLEKCFYDIFTVARFTRLE